MKQNKDIPIGYKDSPLGIIPKDWAVKRLGSIFSQIPTFSFSRDQMSDSEQKLRYVHYGDIHKINEIDSIDLKCIELPFLNDGIIPEEKLKKNNFPYLNNGDVLLTDASEDYAGIGKALEIIDTDNKKIIGGLHTIGLRHKTNELAIGFGRLIFKNGQSSKSLKRIAQGTKVYSISYNHIAKLHVILPPTEDQVKIIEILNCWNEAIEKQKILVEKLERRKRALMQPIMRGKIRLSGFTKKWGDTELGDLLDYIQPTPYLVRDTLYDNTYQIPVLTAGKTFVLGYTNETDGVFVDLPVIIFDDFTTASKFVNFPFKAKSSAMKLLKAKRDVNIKFVYEAMQQIKYAIGGHERHWISKFSFITIPLPSIEEQNSIAELITCFDREIDMARDLLGAFFSQKNSLMQQLLTGKTKLKVK